MVFLEKYKSKSKGGGVGDDDKITLVGLVVLFLKTIDFPRQPGLH